MVMSILSGLMFANLKYLIEQHAPVINRINPAALVTDSFFCLSVYDDYQRFLVNIMTLGIFAVVLTVGSFLAVWRGRYASL
jgi:ABC-2 type transport system permease protein